MQKFSKASPKKNPYIFITPISSKQDLTLAKDKAAKFVLKKYCLNRLKYDKIEIYQKCHQISTFICDLGWEKKFVIIHFTLLV